VRWLSIWWSEFESRLNTPGETSPTEQGEPMKKFGEEPQRKVMEELKTNK